MPDAPNDALWDPRPRLEQEAEHGGAGDDAPPDTGFLLVELAAGPGMSAVAAVALGRELERTGFTLDEEFGATPLGEAPGGQSFLVRGRLADETVVAALESDPRVVRVWRDTPVAPF